MEEQKQQQQRSTATAINTSDQQIVAKPAYKSDFHLFPPGYRFCPLDEELILHYLANKVMNRPLPPNKINKVILKDYNPKNLIEEYKSSGEKEWYFFTSRDRKYRNGKRPDRAAGNGFWKATGADRPVINDGTLIGYKKALVFYEGKPPKGKKTNWVMHEFRVLEKGGHNPPTPTRKDENDMRLDDCVLCKVYEKADKGSKKQQEGSKNKQQEVEVECGPTPKGSDDDSVEQPDHPFSQLTYGFQFDEDQSLQHNLPKPHEPSYGNGCRFDQSLQHNLLKPQEPSYWNDCQFDHSLLQHNLPEPQELSYGITHNFSSVGFNSQNHVGFGYNEAISSMLNESISSIPQFTPISSFQDGLMFKNNNPMISSNQFIDEKLPASSMPSFNQVMVMSSFNQVMDNQLSTSQPSSTLFWNNPQVPSSTQFWNNLQVPKSTAHDDFIFQILHGCDTLEHPPLLLTRQPPALTPQPLKRRLTLRE